MLEVLLLAVALSMDCFAVSIACGAILQRPHFLQALKVGLFFGGFQMLMPFIGWAVGLGFQRLFSRFDHWIAFGLFIAVGGKMLYEAFQIKSEEEKLKKKKNLLGTITLLVLAFATSIDAFIVGLSIHAFPYPIAWIVIIIGSVSLWVSFTGVYLGKKIHLIVGNKAEILGGIILIGMGIKILLENIL